MSPNKRQFRLCTLLKVQETGIVPQNSKWKRHKGFRSLASLNHATICIYRVSWYTPIHRPSQNSATKCPDGSVATFRCKSNCRYCKFAHTLLDSRNRIIYGIEMSCIYMRLYQNKSSMSLATALAYFFDYNTISTIIIAFSILAFPENYIRHCIAIVSQLSNS